MALITARVRWYDSVVFSGWIHPDPELHVPRIIESVGFLVEDNEAFICIASSFDPKQGDDGHWGNLTVIPRAAVNRVLFSEVED